MHRAEIQDRSALLDMFADGPPLRLERLLRLGRRDALDVGRRVVAVVAIGWGAPLAILAVQAVVGRGAGLGSFASDFAVHARSLLAASMLVLAEAVCAPRLGAIAVHFVDAGIVPESQHARFDSIVQSTLRLRDTRLAELGVALLAYSIVLALVGASPETPAWQRPESGQPSLFSLAGWWHVLVSIPLLLMLVLGWLWRVALWTRFLWVVARLELRLIPAHPDLSAGLRFVGHSLRAFSIVGLAFGTIVAGTLANRVERLGTSPLDYKSAVLGVVVFVVVLFGAPILVFTRSLLDVWRRGVLQYGGLAGRLGRAFESKWLGERDLGPALEAPDFSATIDLYSVVAYVYQMRFVPVDFISLGALVFATLLPFVPVFLIGLPIEVVLGEIAKLLF